MAIRLATGPQNAAADAIAAKVDAGTGSGTIKVYTGTQPATANDVATGTLLATFTLTDPAFAAAASGVITLDADPDLTTTGVADGDAGWARCADSDGNAVFDGSVATSGGDFTINTLAITTGGTVNLTAGTLTMPSGA